MFVDFKTYRNENGTLCQNLKAIISKKRKFQRLGTNQHKIFNLIF